MSVDACQSCLRRTWLLRIAAGHLDHARHRIGELLSLPDYELIEAVAGTRRKKLLGEYEAFEPVRATRRLERMGLSAICRCAAMYPVRLHDLPAPPAVLHVAGSLDALQRVCGADSVAIVGARRASPYGLEVARSLARRLAVGGVPVISGMAAGIDCAAHDGALSAEGLTVAVLAGEPQRPYPGTARTLHRRILATGAVVSELGPGTTTRRWMFPVRNRVVAALASMTVVVEAGARSGALLTASVAQSLGRCVGAVPGRVTSPLAVGSHALLRGGARLVRGPEDVLESLFGTEGSVDLPDPRPRLADAHQVLLDAIARGADTPAGLSRVGISAAEGLAGVAWLELTGYVRREAGGRWSVVP